ncbi:MAG: fatty acid desaturase [Bdellovibrionales bacterium]|nr:fatty acid desaturase [Bdellovibrionales bacterium]
MTRFFNDNSFVSVETDYAENSDDLCDDLRALSTWRGLFPCFLSWATIAVAIATAIRFPVIYLLAVLIIANRILALFLLSHEAVHALLTPHRRLNDFVGRYLCAFPVGVSFQQWRSKHLLHHRFLGSGLDPDLPIYSGLFETWSSFLKSFASGKVSMFLLIYFTPIDRILNRVGVQTPYLSMLMGLSEKGRRSIGFDRNDIFSFVTFHTIIAISIFSLNLTSYFTLYWVVPHLIVQFYFPIWSHLQHGGIFKDPVFNRRSRSINSPLWIMPLLMPVNVRFHLEHHLYPFVPQYKLANAAKRICNRPAYQNRHENLLNALRSRSHLSILPTGEEH